ncbi:N-acetylmuramoyl-L-alanine amidase [Rickettsia hoogstraalii]|uniref:N-acetylmuramoyl-L-alanine amidase n=1 Tax=Rickettsia hoogstraalii TaxID=467174 RepID=UPI000590139A|nr:N-acetylmuramoyl-L-alanine amidase [Rickettsia hoogstraalii]
MIVIDKTSYRAVGFDKRIKFLVLHYTQCDFKQSLDFLTGEKLSSHYLINNENPEHIFQLVEEHDRAWHAGVSYWQGYERINDTSIGIEIVNPAFEINTKNNNIVWLPYAERQINSVISLCKQIIARYDIKPTRVVGHSDIAPGRKQDPGPLFPWKLLYDNDIGAWYDEQIFNELLPQVDITDIKAIQQKFITYGYKLEATGILDSKMKDVIISFQIHFRPSNFSGDLDAETIAILDALILKYKSELSN